MVTAVDTSLFASSAVQPSTLNRSIVCLVSGGSLSSNLILNNGQDHLSKFRICVTMIHVCKGLT